MTVELGNINKGIPMGSYTPGEGGGGGGTAKVTGVDPIAVTNGSVAIKIDEQTLQVNEQGELSANLDELGNEVNAIAGDVTALQADVLKKQDKLTAGNNITISADNVISSTGGGGSGDVTLAGDNSFTGNNTFGGVSTFQGDTWVDFLKIGTYLVDQQDKKFLTQNTVTAGDNITITDTTNGIQIASTASGGGMEVKTASSANFNSAELLETGLYYISSAFIPQNGPVKYAVAAMLVTMKYFDSSSNQRIQQTWRGCDDLAGNQVWVRYSKPNGVMNSWVRVDSNKIASASALGAIKVGDGLSIATDGTLSATGGGGASDTEKYGLEGDYCSKYGIVDCPNGILTEEAKKVTLKAGVVMQMTETDGLTTNASDMPHDIISTVDFDLFYTSGSLLEATQVVFSEQEPEDGATGVLAWFNGTQWQFKSNTEGNVWRAASAVRLAHVHITDGNITRIDYIGNRHLNKVIPVTTNTAQTITGSKTLKNNLILNQETVESGIQCQYIDDSGLTILSSLIQPSNLSLGDKFAVLNIGLSNAKLQLFGKSIRDKDNKILLTQGNVTAGDNITITNTSTGIQISSAGAGGGVTSKAYITETYANGSSGYRLWSDGFCEQWGVLPGNSTETLDHTVTLLKSFKDTNYHVEHTSISKNTQTVSVLWQWIAIAPLTTNSFTLPQTQFTIGWKAFGYLPEG